MKKIFLIIGALLAVLMANAQQPWTLQQCVDTALANNRNIKQKELTRKTNEIAYQQARNNLLPNLNGSASQGWSFGRSQIADGTYQNLNVSNTSFSLSSGITLFDGLKMKYNIDARMADLKASEANLEKIRQDIILSVSSAFLQVLLNKELLQISENQLELTQNKIEQQKSLVAAGKLAEGEMYELLAQQSKEELSRTQAENSLKLSLLDLGQILELSDFEKLDVIAPADLMNNELQMLDAENVYRSALNNRPEVKSAEYQLKNSEKNVQIAKSAYFPSLSFGASVSGGYYNSVSTPTSTSLGFNLSVPIFNKMETRNQVKTAQINVESNRLNVDNTKLELRKTIQQAYYNAVAAKAKWDAARKSEIAGNEAYRFANQKYEGGRATVYELYQAKNNLTQAQSEVVQSKYEYVFRLKILELLM
ncbi:MAG: TolC family protein [Bacteroidales bacterium]|nr:TolC family protein [Bacteroidales bacterium]